MSLGQRVRSILAGLAMTLCAMFALQIGEDGLPFVLLALGVTLLAYGIKTLAYYLTMARHMVGGKVMLFVAIFSLDAGMLALSLVDASQVIVALYLIAIHAFSGATGMAHSLEERAYGSPWRLDALNALVHLLVVVACIGTLGSPDLLVRVYSAGLFYSAAMHIVSAFRNTDIVYIP